MPCDNSYQNPSPREQESARVIRFLQEIGLPHGKPHECYGNVGTLDADTRRLCTWCKDHRTEIKDHSLEFQIWWRDHQKADVARAEARVQAAKVARIRKQALKKLTLEERKALKL